MSLFVCGLALFFGSHLFTSFARGPREALIGRLGEKPYKGLYSVVSLVGFVLIVLGWPAASTEPVFTPPTFGPEAAVLLTVPAFILLTAAYLPTGKLKAWTGHPMITGTGFFAAGHLFANGDLRSVLLFGGFLVYALLDRLSYKLRGDRGAKGGKVAWDLAAVIGGLVGAYLVIHHLHPYLAGVALDPGHLFGS
ncbi:MAG: NnrU family protein [Parvularcula sp.]|jgi:uncharacterized membrane protein|nr:NnrU family protein [Parvularcula sp.]